MAKRPVFVPNMNGFPFVEVIEIEFEWFSGFAKSQAQKSIASQHSVAQALGITPVLEISSKSVDPLGVSLSAFNLILNVPNQLEMSVECAFQGSKVFENGGPYTDLYSVSSRDAKTDPRIRNSGDVIAFRFLGEDFPVTPKTAFYDWLYISALWQNPVLSTSLTDYNAFSDIAFNPEHSLNCQACSAAIYVSLLRNADVERVVNDQNYYLDLMTCKQGKDLAGDQPGQMTMFG